MGGVPWIIPVGPVWSRGATEGRKAEEREREEMCREERSLEPEAMSKACEVARSRLPCLTPEGAFSLLSLLSRGSRGRF